MGFVIHPVASGRLSCQQGHLLKTCYLSTMGTNNARCLVGGVVSCLTLLCLTACGIDSSSSQPPTVAAGSGTGGSTPGASGSTALPQCPAQEPTLATPCETNVTSDCSYDVCGTYEPTLWRCTGRTWVNLRACGPFECPVARPRLGDDCAPLDGLVCDCDYTETDDCCGGTHPVQARCTNGHWTVVDENTVCSICRVLHLDGDDCILPDGCTQATCVRLGCYGQTGGDYCYNGMWHVVPAICDK